MSKWTSIVGVLSVDTCIEDINIKTTIEKMLLSAPKITGSEGDADVFVNVVSGYNTYYSCECCELGSTIVKNIDGAFSCEIPKDYTCKNVDYQTCVVITVVGSLRDREKKQTNDEYNKFREYVEKECSFIIKNESINIR